MAPNKMFESKQEFKKEYERRLLETYGVSVKESHISEKYTILGEMIRDQQGVQQGNYP